MVQNYIVRKLEHKKTENNKVERTQIQIKPKRYKQMKFANIRQYYDKLIDNFKEGIQKQIKEPNVAEYKIDKYFE